MTEKRLKIMFVLPALEAGGAERVMITLANGLSRTEFDPSMVVVRKRGALENMISPDIRVSGLKGVRVETSIFQLWAKIRKENPDVVVSTMAHMNFALLLLRSFFPKVKFIVREAITPSFLLQGRPLAQQVLIRFLYRLLYPKADLVLSPAARILDEMREFLGVSLPQQKTVVLPNPVDVEILRSTPARRKEGSGVRFICSGRLHPQKGFDRLIESLAGFERPGGWHLTILGEGTEREKLEVLVRKHNLQDHITLAGYRAEPWGEVAGADVFLLPSRWEGLPNVVLESLAVGTPVIAMKEAGGVAEIAAAAKPGDVVVAKSMADFINTMKNISITPIPPEGRESILPEMFRKETVLSLFSALLRGVI
jgi:glycosyltransferase involved in cell wall biosynthesis